MLKQNAVWLITGCSKGLGRDLALLALQSGYRVVVTARDISTLDEIVQRFSNAAAVQLDVADADAAQRAVAFAHERFGALDVLVNNAGHGYMGAIEEGDDLGVRAMFEVNVFGTLNMIKAALPAMRERRSGHIVNVGSLAGWTTSPGGGYYSMAKFAVEALSDTLAKEVGPLGIGVTVATPGAFRTDFRGGSMKLATVRIDDYAATVGKMRDTLLAGHGKQPGDPALACRVILEALQSEHPPVHLFLGNDAVDMLRKRLADVERDIVEWEHMSRSTDIDKT